MRVCLFLSLICTACSTPSKLESYNVEPSAVSVSGISSGGSMASQYHVAHSRDVMGAGIIAGAMWGGGGGNAIAAQSVMTSPSLISLSVLHVQAATAAFLGNIDPTSNMRDDRIYIFSGSMDTVMNPAMGRKTESFYKYYVRNSSQIKTVFDIKAQHGMPTLKSAGRCERINKPDYLNNCHYDAAFDLLNHVYGGGLRRPDNTTNAGGQLIHFDQGEFFAFPPISYSMDSTGYVYVPTGCTDRNTKCKLHVAFHGCMMGRKIIHDKYVRNAGYNEVGEVNNVIILYPQLVNTPLQNSYGCWDWWGYTGMYYATKLGFQVEGVRRMIDRLIA